MDQRLIFPKGDLSPHDSASDPEEKEFSDDDDDDRNHKHRRRETQTHSLERDPVQVSTRPYRNRNKPFENGHPHREAASQSNETWRNYNMPPLDKDFPGKFDRRRPGSTPVSRSPLDLNQRGRGNQSWTGDPGSGRGRGREFGSWAVRDSRFSSVDFNPTIAQQGYVPSSLFAGRGMSSVANSQSASWTAFGLVPGLPNGGLDSLHSLGLQRNLRAPINPSMNMGMPHQRCRDFEERGFCLRGDMCPMEHGINRIVIEDVQSLSQFNLPVTLPSAHVMGASAGPGPSSAVSAPSSTLGNGQGVYSNSSKAGADDDGLGSNGATVGSSVATGADFYDPDQPLWTIDSARTSTELLAPDLTKVTRGDNQPVPTHDQHIGLYSGSANEHPVKNSGSALGSHSTTSSVRGQSRSLKNRIISVQTGIANEDQVLDTVEDAVGHQGKMSNADDIVSHSTESMKTLNNPARFIQKPSQKAKCTLFVSGIPQKDNKRDALLSHFQKFGEVINVYIPSNSERAFVQFSKREEAEDALKAPDAVMGNRFINLWWANRDNVPVGGISTASSVPLASPVVTAASVPDVPAVATKGKDVPKGNSSHDSVLSVPSFDHPKSLVNNGPTPAMQKKVENLDYLKEIRKKQEMLDRKRSEFKRALERLEKQKQATGSKADLAMEQAAKRHKGDVAADIQKAGSPISIGSSSIISSTQAEMTDRSRSGGNIKPQSSDTSTMMALTESSSFKQSTRQQALAGTPFVMNRFKLDNRPTSFKIIPPLPSGLANVSALKEHFSTFGELSNVDLEDIEMGDDADESIGSNKCACVYFTTRHSAEKAFSNGKCWKGQNMQFIWLTSINVSKEDTGRENPSSPSIKGSSDANSQPVGEAASLVSQKTTMSGDEESENSEQRDKSSDHVVPDDEMHSSLTPASSEKQSSQG